MSELVMDQLIIWDQNNKKQVEEAKVQVLRFKRLGYDILLANGKTMVWFRPYYEQVLVKARRVCKCVMRVLNDSGDDRIVWDRDNGFEAMDAKKKFEDLLRKGYKAYSVRADGKKGRRIKEFDVDAEDIIMVPKTSAG